MGTDAEGICTQVNTEALLIADPRVHMLCVPTDSLLDYTLSPGWRQYAELVNRESVALIMPMLWCTYNMRHTSLSASFCIYP